MSRSRRLPSKLKAPLALAVALAAADVAVACTDGVTPDCNDPAVQCGAVDTDASPDANVTVPDAAPDAPTTDAGEDAADAADAADANDDGG